MTNTTQAARTASRNMAKRIAAVLMSLVLAAAFVPVAPAYGAYYSTNLLNVTKFDEVTGDIKWTDYPGAETYWYEAIDGITAKPPNGLTDAGSELEVNIKDKINSWVESRDVAKTNSYTIVVYATDKDTHPIAEWSGTLTWTPTADPIPLGTLSSVTESDGVLIWDSYSDASSYVLEFNAQGAFTTTTPSANLKTVIDSLIANNALGKPADNKYSIRIRGLNSSGIDIAEYTTTFTYASSAVANTVAALPVTFSSSTGKASWPAVSGASTYWCTVDGKTVLATEKSADE